MSRRGNAGREPLLLRLTIEPRTDADRERLGFALSRLMTDDPPFRAQIDDRLGRVVLFATDERQLMTLVERLWREFHVEAAVVGPPQVAYKERLTRPADGEAKWVGEAPDGGRYAHVKIHVFPAAPETGCLFENDLAGGQIPAPFVGPVEEGIREALATGVLAGHPVDDVRIVLYDGSYHSEDSSPAAFRLAGAMAVLEAAAKAEPVLLEPIMRVEVTVPAEDLRETVRDIVQRRGRIHGQHDRGSTQVVDARVPLGELFGYASYLHSRTGGRATYTVRFDRYEPRRHDGRDGPESFVTARRPPGRPPGSSWVAWPDPESIDE